MGVLALPCEVYSPRFDLLFATLSLREPNLSPYTYACTHYCLGPSYCFSSSQMHINIVLESFWTSYKFTISYRCINKPLDLQKSNPNIGAWAMKEKHRGAANFASVVISSLLTISKRSRKRYSPSNQNCLLKPKSNF